MELFWPLWVARWLHVASLIVLFGAALFPVYGAAPAARGDAHRAVLRRIDVRLSALALLTGAGWLVLSLLDIADEDPGALLSGSLWHTYLFETGLGSIWIARLLGLAALLVAAVVLPLRGLPIGRSSAIAGLSGILLIELGCLGHAAAAQGTERFAGFVGYGCHVLAAGAWIGGLLPLAMELRAGRDRTDTTQIRYALEAFSRMGMITVAIIAASGLMNAALRAVSLDDLIRTTYGRMLLAKIVLFAVLLAIAAANRWVFLPRLRGVRSGQPVHVLVRSLVLEQALGMAVVGLAAALGLLSPSE